MKKILSILLSVVMVLSAMNGLSFNVQAAQTIQTINLQNIDKPLPGRTQDLTFSIGIDGVGVDTSAAQVVSWYDLSLTGQARIKPLPKDTKFVQGHQYMVTVALMAVDGYNFATNGNNSAVSAKINSQDAFITQWANKSAAKYINVSYVFEKCDYNKIYSVKLNSGVFAKGTVLSNTFFSTTTEGVEGVICSFRRDGKDVDYGSTVNYGDYGFSLLMAPKIGYKFADGLVVNYNAQYLYISQRIGEGIFVKSDDDFFHIDCIHSYGASYEKDGVNHWKQCTNCGEKANIEQHTFGKGVLEGNVTTYTCTKCGYKKTNKYTETGFLFGDCDGGVQLISYNGTATNVTVPSKFGDKNVVSIADFAFATCPNRENITKITLPTTVRSIGKGAFNYCTGLTSFDVPANVVRIENETFSGCSALTSVTLPYGITFIGESAFQSSGIKSIIIPCSVRTIGKYAFRQCDSLSNVVIPDGVTSVGDYAFIASKGLETAVIGNRITKIPQSMFSGCEKLKTVILPSGLTDISNYAFDKTALTNVYFRGTSEQFNAINIVSKDDHNKKLVDAKKTYNYTTKHEGVLHHYVVKKVVEPTCVEDGYTFNECEGCGDFYKTDIKKATGIHQYNSGMITIEPYGHDGEKVYICNICGATKTEVIPEVKGPITDSAEKGATVDNVDKYITGLTNDNDPKGSVFSTLQAKASKVTKSSVKLSWKKASGAKGYIVYGNKCGKKNKYKKIKAVSGSSFTQKKLKKGTYYKYLVVAYDKNNKVISTSKTIHAATTGGKVGNAKSLKTKAKKNKVTIKVKKTFNLKAKAVAKSKKLKMKKHRAIQFESTNKKVATVSSKGVIKGKAKGKCYVYAYAQNGICKKIKVTVK